MKLGFDLDGVLCDIDVVTLHLMHKLTPEKEELAELYYYTERKPLLNPKNIMTEWDEYHIITGRHEGLADVTKRWVSKFLPDVKSLHIVGEAAWYKLAARADDDAVWEEYAEKSIMNKVDKIIELGINFYIDDSVTNVRRLREELPDITVLQYGGRLR